MSDDLMRYDLLAQEALRGVVRQALLRVERSGLPGDHHFYISFFTRHRGVAISEALRKRYEKDMTIVLQHQYENLHVTKEGFEVELLFNGVPEKLAVPFAAIKAFFDPAAQFALQFEMAEEKIEVAPKPAPKRPDPFGAAEASVSAETVAAANAAPAPSNDDLKVVSLDSFRKK